MFSSRLLNCTAFRLGSFVLWAALTDLDPWLAPDSGVAAPLEKMERLHTKLPDALFLYSHPDLLEVGAFI